LLEVAAYCLPLVFRYTGAKEAGALRLEGKEYIVQEVRLLDVLLMGCVWSLRTLVLSFACSLAIPCLQGDVLLFRFNV
jgi:hypothetical protein